MEKLFGFLKQRELSEELRSAEVQEGMKLNSTNLREGEMET